MKEQIFKTIGQLQYEISLLEQSEEDLTGVSIKIEELKDLVKNCSISDVGLTLPLPDENSMRQIAQHVRNSEDIREPLIYEQGIIRGMQIMKNIVFGN